MNAKTNRLARESSPYLLQHAHNPVDWYPWGEEAFRAARERDVPIFLSIGYATCYWCHVMERESFENERIAALMNERFVCVKVDREERPEVDDIYMAATVMMSGYGGWPMSVFLEPTELRPFWCGTYFPAAPMPGMGNRPTFPQVLEALSAAWGSQRDEIMQQAAQLGTAIAEELGTPRPPQGLGLDTVSACASALLKTFDRTRGGFGGAPKFPQPVYLDFLLDLRASAGDDSTADATDEAVRRTLTSMMIGGLFDQIGGGFHRYSVDAQWTVPHFEKMLYDNAQLAAVYARAAKHFGDRCFEETARRTLEFVERELTAPNGLFFSALDAEVDGREGLNYLWNPAEFEAVLDSDDAAFAIKLYGLDAGPNFRDPHHPHEPAANIPRLHDRPERVSRELNIGEVEFTERVRAINASLLAHRNTRKGPRLDDKSVTSWNAMMIEAFARAGDSLGDAAYIGVAARAADAVWKCLWNSETLARSWRAGSVGIGAGVLEDYAAMMQALAVLARVDAARANEWIARATRLRSAVRERFVREDGALFDVERGRGDLFVRTKSVHDGAMPSGCSVLINALLDLEQLTSDPSCGDEAVRLLAGISGNVAGAPTGSVHAVRALLRLMKAGGARAAVFAVDAPPTAAPKTAQEREVVQIFAGVERLVVGKGHPAQTRVLVKIAPGWHVGAADALNLVPLRVGVINGAGVVAYADYPPGEEYGSSAAGKTRILRGEFELPIVLEAEGDWRGKPLLAMTYQACSDTECLAPTTVELDIAIDRA